VSLTDSADERADGGFSATDERFMRLALTEARAATDHGDTPVGAVVVRDGEVIATGRNERELRGDPTAHAETIALREAARAVGNWRVLDATLYVTLEPCAMCAGAIVLARVERVVFGAWDDKAGMGGSVGDLLRHRQLNHRPEVTAGVCADASAALLAEFFAARRAEKREGPAERA
jgi:tRNA(adenine34) deaminase